MLMIWGSAMAYGDLLETTAKALGDPGRRFWLSFFGCSGDSGFWPRLLETPDAIFFFSGCFSYFHELGSSLRLLVTPGDVLFGLLAIWGSAKAYGDLLETTATALGDPGRRFWLLISWL